MVAAVGRDRLQRYVADPAAFRADLFIDQGGDLVRLGDVLEPWQDADFRATDPGWQFCAGRWPADGGPVIQRAYLERPRGHSKTSDIAVDATWAMAFAKRPIRGYAAAADKDQARLLRDAILRLIRNNPWLSQVLEVQAYSVRNIAKGHAGAESQLEILSCDVGSSYGLLPDFIVCDELTHWTGGGDLWHSLISSAAKRPSCFVQVITNAGSGAGTSWQWEVREAARNDTDWYFRTLDGPHAKWITAKVLAEQQRLLPPKVYQRLWLNRWSTGGDVFDLADITACVTLDGPMLSREPGWMYVAGLDLGISRDHSALVVLGVHRESRRVALASVQSWSPPPGGKIDLTVVQNAVADADRTYNLEAVCFDPYQAELMAQQLVRAGVTMEPVPFVGQNLNRMASTLVEAIQSRRLELFNDARLIGDLSSLNIVPRSYGLKLEAARDGTGHADRATALAIVLPRALELVARKQIDAAAWLDLQTPLPTPAIALLRVLATSPVDRVELQEADGGGFSVRVGTRALWSGRERGEFDQWRELLSLMVSRRMLSETLPEREYQLTERGRLEASASCREMFFQPIA